VLQVQAEAEALVIVLIVPQEVQQTPMFQVKEILAVMALIVEIFTLVLAVQAAAVVQVGQAVILQEALEEQVE
jgi:NhaP-type Na+/H+ or K+/H+ antiporter